MDGRQQRGMQIAADGGVSGSGGLWQVISQSKPRTRYAVNPATGQCTCPDNSEAGMRCKHVWAVTFTMTAEVSVDGKTVASERITYSQEWSTYNRAQVEEKDTFMRLLADLCSTVPQPPQATGRPRLPLADMAFAATFKVYSRFSSRRFSSDLREAEERGLILRAPHFNSVSNYISDPGLTPVLHDLIGTSAIPLRAVETDFAIDSSGFSTSRFDHWIDHKYGKPTRMLGRHWIKAHIMVGVRTNVVTGIEVTPAREHDGEYLRPLVHSTASRFQIAEVSADKAYLSRRNAEAIEAVGAKPYIPFKSNSVAPNPAFDGMETAWSRMWHAFAYNRDAFMRSYHKRSNVEAAFSMIKGKFGDSVLSKSDTGQENEVLCKVLAHNIVIVGQAALELGIDPAYRPAVGL